MKHTVEILELVHAPECAATVGIETQRWREGQSRYPEPEKCGRRGKFKIDDVWLCGTHAGQRALEILINESH